MKTHKPRKLVSALLAIAASAVVIAGVAVAYLNLGHHLGPDRGAFVGLVAALLGMIAACAVLRARAATGRWLAGLVLGLVGVLGFATAWGLRIAPESIIAVDAWMIYHAVVGFLTQPPPTELWVIIGAEAGVLIAMSVTMARSFSVQQCNWCTSTSSLESDVARRADSADVGEIKRRLENHQWDWFRALGAPESDARSWIRFDLGSCTCGLTRTLRAVRVRKLGLDREIVRELRQRPDDVRVIRGFALPEQPVFDELWKEFVPPDAGLTAPAARRISA